MTLRSLASARAEVQRQVAARTLQTPLGSAQDVGKPRGEEKAAFCRDTSDGTAVW